MRSVLRPMAAVMLLIFSVTTVAATQMMATMSVSGLPATIPDSASMEGCPGEATEMAESHTTQNSLKCCDYHCSGCLSNNLVMLPGSVIEQVFSGYASFHLYTPALADPHLSNLIRPPISV